MSTTFDIMDRLYPFLNVATVTATINGRLYKRKRPLNSESRDIVLLSNLRDGDELDVQPGVFFVNCHAKNKDKGMVDDSNLKTTVDAVISRIDVWNQGSTYLHLEKDFDIIVQDQDRDDSSYASVRYNIIIE